MNDLAKRRELSVFLDETKEGDLMRIGDVIYAAHRLPGGSLELNRVPTAKDMKNLLGYDPAAELAHVQAVVAHYWPPNTITRYKDRVITEEHFEAED